MKLKLQRAKRTLDNMKKREADALAAKAAAETRLEALEAQVAIQSTTEHEKHKYETHT